MANKPRLSPKVLDFLHKRLGKSVTTVRSDISRLKRDCPQATLNAVAQIYAEQHGESVRRLIDKEDKMTIPYVKIETTPSLKSKKRITSSEQLKQII